MGKRWSHGRWAVAQVVQARFGISVLTEHWGMGIGRVLMESCIRNECAPKKAELHPAPELRWPGNRTSAVPHLPARGVRVWAQPTRGYRSRLRAIELVHMKRL